MLNLIGRVAVEHDVWLVLLAGILCMISANTAIALLSRAHEGSRSGRARWLLGAAFVTGCGIWATHFVAMLAFQPAMPVGYSGAETMLSYFAAVLLTGVGYWVAVEWRPLSGGLITGLAIAAAHFLGILGMRVQAVEVWNIQLAAAAIAFGLIVSALAFHVAVAKRHIYDRTIAALLLTIAVCGLHFMAVAAVTLSPDPSVLLESELLQPRYLALAVAAIALLIVGTGRVCYAVDQHLERRVQAEAQRLRTYIGELEQTQRELRGTTVSLEEALAEAARASQAKSQFLATMSHELRTPLNAVIGFAELLSEETFGPLTPIYKDYATTIRDSGRHLLGIINDVLDVSKLDADRLELREDTVSVEDIVEECVRIMMQPASAGEVGLEADVEPNLPYLWADQQRVRQIILNLLSNAVKFTPAGGQVRVAAFSSEGRLVVRVADNGIGMRPEDIPTAMERFGQVDNSLSRRTEGTGLGLPLSKRLTELHGGNFVLDSALGVGTSISLTFPAERVVFPAMSEDGGGDQSTPDETFDAGTRSGLDPSVDDAQSDPALDMSRLEIGAPQAA